MGDLVALEGGKLPEAERRTRLRERFLDTLEEAFGLLATVGVGAMAPTLPSSLRELVQAYHLLRD